jgi:glycosyltransferase involved in cell wall biosynthesis
VSVVIPTFERPRRLARCVAALAELDYPRDLFEVLVVDDGGSVLLDGEIPSLGTAIDGRVLRQNHAGPAAARNYGASNARYQLLAFIDDDCLPRRDWLAALSRRHRAKPRAAISGRVVNALTGNIYSKASQMLIDRLRHYYNRPAGNAGFAISANLAFPTETFRATGGFDTTFPRAGGEDRELCDRWLCNGHEIEYADDAVVDHYHELSLGAFCRQHFNYGCGAYEFRQARIRRAAGPVRREPLSFYVDLLPAPSRDLSEYVSLTALTILSQVANVAGFTAEAAVRRRRAVTS